MKQSSESELKSIRKKVVFPIDGMHCASCAITIEKSLQKKSGVANASVNFASEKAYVEYDPSLTGVKSLEDVVREAGYDVHTETQKLVLRIGGMSCASCASTVEKELKKAEGVLSAGVNFATENATVEFDSAVTNLQKLPSKKSARTSFGLTFTTRSQFLQQF